MHNFSANCILFQREFNLDKQGHAKKKEEEHQIHNPSSSDKIPTKKNRL